MAKKEKHTDQPDKKNALEWTVFGFSAACIIALFAYLIYETINYKPSSPDLRVKYAPHPSENEPYRYRLSIRNEGVETAEEVQLELVMFKDGEEVENANLSVPFVPQYSERIGWMIFSKDPASADSIVARVLSYKKP